MDYDKTEHWIQYMTYMLKYSKLTAWVFTESNIHLGGMNILH